MRRQQALDLALSRVAALVEPVDIGSIVWERADDQADHDRRGGMVVDVKRDGELVCAQTRRTRGKNYVVAWTLRTDQLDPALTVPPSTTKMRRMARDICTSLGNGSGAFDDGDLVWLSRARDLATEVPSS